MNATTVWPHVALSFSAAVAVLGRLLVFGVLLLICRSGDFLELINPMAIIYAADIPAKPAGNEGERKNNHSDSKAGEDSKRNGRWVMSFNTDDGPDYLRQLAAVGAIVAVPADAKNEKFIAYRNLKVVPTVGRVEDIRSLKLISWADENPKSIRTLAKAMKLPKVPEFVVVFFPLKLEEELAKLELDYRPGTRLDQIKYTKFRVTLNGENYSVKVIDQK